MMNIVSVPDPKPIPAQIAFSIACVILEAIYAPDEVWGRDYDGTVKSVQNEACFHPECITFQQAHCSQNAYLHGCLFEIVSLRTVHCKWSFLPFRMMPYSIKIPCLLCFYGKLCEAVQCVHVKAFPTEQVYKYPMLCKTSFRGNPPLLIVRSPACH